MAKKSLLTPLNRIIIGAWAIIAIILKTAAFGAMSLKIILWANLCLFGFQPSRAISGMVSIGIEFLVLLPNYNLTGIQA
jgi:hypothetical protein